MGKTNKTDALDAKGLAILLHNGTLPGQQVVDVADGVVRDAFEDVVEIELRVEAVELGGSEQRVDAGSTFTAGVGPGKEEVLRPKATTRNARSAALLSISIWPSSKSLNAYIGRLLAPSTLTIQRRR